MNVSRRDFIATMTAVVGGGSLAVAHRPTRSYSTDEMTIQDVIDRILKDLPAEPDPNTVDTVKIGDPSRPVAGIATTFLATAAVLQEAADRGANLVITHEPTFFNHLDEVDWLATDPVYRAKVDLIEDHGMVVWRLHDRVHRKVRDDITLGVMDTLGWTDFASDEDNYVCRLPGTSLHDLALFLKSRIGSKSVRTVGDPEMICEAVGVLMGAWGGRRQIELLSRPEIDVLVCGEVNEWETAEYVRDARSLGIKKGLVVVGHALSEEPGMLWMTDWIRDRLPQIPIAHLPARDPFRYL